MEDSRNIIKAIDALTLKAGGEVVDSKNITEAIDNLKAVFDQEAIGIDDTLTQEGLAADAKAVGNLLGVTHPNISDVLTPAEDVTISYSFVSLCNKLLIIDCCFSQTSRQRIDRFSFKSGYTPDVYSRNIAPVFLYSDSKVSDTVLFINRTTLTGFGDPFVPDTEYYFHLVCFIK